VWPARILKEKEMATGKGMLCFLVAAITLPACSSNRGDARAPEPQPYTQSDVDRIAESLSKSGKWTGETSIEICATSCRREVDGTLLLLSGDLGRDVTFRIKSDGNERGSPTPVASYGPQSRGISVNDLHTGIRAHDALLSLDQAGHLWVRAWDVETLSKQVKVEATEFGFGRLVFQQ